MPARAQANASTGRGTARAPAVVKVGVSDLVRFREAVLDEAPAEFVLLDLDYLIARAREAAWTL